jgi:hypothetical protein
MALRFVADHCVSNSTVQTLSEANHEVLRLKDVLPVESSDTIVITKAQEIDAIQLSLNGTKELSRCRCTTTQKLIALALNDGNTRSVSFAQSQHATLQQVP